MKKTVIFTCLLLALCMIGSVSADVLVDLDASGLPEGELETWTNTGTAGGVFLSQESHLNADNETIADPNAVVEIVDGINAVSFADGSWMQSTIPAPNELSEANPWSILIWAYADGASMTAGDCLFQWADRGGGTAEFCSGTNYAFIGWDDLAYTSPPPTDQWFHYTATYDGTELKIYINGIEDAVAAKTLDIRQGDLMQIARAQPGNLWGDQPFTGSIASIQVHDTALTQLEIQQLGGVFEPGTLTPTDLSIMEGNGTEEITVQVYMNPLTSAGPTSDLEVTLSFAGDYADAQLGTSAMGDPYVITVPAASYSDPILVSIVAEDDAILEGAHAVYVRADVTAGDPDYVGLSLTPFGGLPVTVVDNDFAPCPEPELVDGGYVDNFDCPWDFNVGATGFWDGFMNAGNASSANTIASSGLLTLDGTGNWNGNETTGPFLYAEVTGDFVAEVHLVAPTTSAGGLMVRLGGDLALGGAGEDNMWLAAWSSWNVGSIFWPTDDGARPEYANSADGDAGGPSWLRVERRGAEFYWYRSYDGVVWESIEQLPDLSFPLVREDMNVPTLQVGIVQSFDGDPIEYDYFKLKPARGSISGTLYLTESTGDTGTVQLQLDTEGVPAPIADIDVTLSAVAAFGADPNSDPNDVLIGTSAFGETYSFTIPAAAYDQPQLVDVTATIDAYDEPDQQLTLAADITSTDPNWTGLFLATDALITVMETPGLLVLTGDGVEVTEDGATDSFTVQLKIPPLTVPVTVAIADDADPDQVTPDSASLSFGAADWMTPQAVTVTAVDDAVLEADPHAAALTLTPTNGDEYDALAPSTVAVSILENECGAWGYVWADFDTDCDVDLDDLAVMAAAWLDCTNPYDAGCVDLR